MNHEAISKEEALRILKKVGHEFSLEELREIAGEGFFVFDEQTKKEASFKLLKNSALSLGACNRIINKAFTYENGVTK